MNYKDILAKLLATENLSVVHENVETASFNVKDRVLSLPTWNDMQDFTYDHLVGHEVGHALYTPVEGLHDAVTEHGAGFKSFLNVIEDARIEKLVQRKYPGLRRGFVKSYRKMLAEGFFGGDLDQINDMKLIDRINTYFKCGVSAGVRISADESKWIREIEAIETWEQVVDVASRLYAKAKEEQEQEQKQKQEMQMSEDEEDDSSIPEYDPYEDDGDEFGEDEFDMPATQEEQVDESLEPLSKTDEALRASIHREHSSSVTTDNYVVPNIDAKQFIVNYKTLLEETNNLANIVDDRVRYIKNVDDFEEEAKSLYTKFMANNKKTINYLVKEFEMKKSAANYTRATISKTGMIDPVKMNSYRYNDDIFRKVTIVPDGKSHGMIMYLDWSGSMHADLYNTVEQTLNLVYFCRQVNIPFRVYAFTNGFQLADEENNEVYEKRFQRRKDAIASIPDNTIYPEEDFRLLEFFSNKMNKLQMSRMSKVLLFLAKYIACAKRPYVLYGTPLDTSIALAGSVFRDFKRANPVDIVNTIFLTDGDSHAPHVKKTYENIGRNHGYLEYLDRFLPYRHMPNEFKVMIHDEVTKRQYHISRDTLTKQLLAMYKDQTGSTVIGYRIMPASKHQFFRSLSRHNRTHDVINEYYEIFKKENYVNVRGEGYDKFFTLKGGKHLETSNNSFEVSEDAKKGEISRAFRSANKKRLVSRSLLNEFVAEVA
jgi:hypothetical protein